MIQRRRLKRWLLALAALHGIVACAGFLAPYDPAEQDRERPYLPPMTIHLVDSQGVHHLRPFFYAVHLRDGSFDQFEESTEQPVPLQFFVTGARYRLLGLVPAHTHFFGAQASRIYLLGSDAYGRDQLSRILYGGQISLLAGLLGAGLTLFLGVLVGASAGYYGGWRDGLFMRVAELLSPSASHLARNFERHPDASCNPRAPIRACRDDSFLSGTRGARTSAHLGQPPCQSSAIQCPVILLVDVRARFGNRAVLSRIPGPGEYVAPGRRHREDREDK